jgi:hypothetical protein
MPAVHDVLQVLVPADPGRLAVALEVLADDARHAELVEERVEESVHARGEVEPSARDSCVIVECGAPDRE